MSTTTSLGHTGEATDAPAEKSAAPARAAISEHISAATIAGSPEVMIAHPLNPNSQIFFRAVSTSEGAKSLSEVAGLQRLGVHQVRIPPGKESFAYHSHHGEEEFVFILSGRGVAEINDREVEVGPGDFLGFRTPGCAHHLKNPFSEDLVCLMAGERRELEVAEFPRLGKRLIRTKTSGDAVDVKDQRNVWKFE